MAGTARGLSLTDDDYVNLGRRGISPEVADAAGLRRVDSFDGRDIVGRKTGDCAGIAIDYRRPGSPDVIQTRLRLDHPPVDPNGKSEGKYLSASGTRNCAYYPPCDRSSVLDISIPVLITEGEFKGLAGHCAALQSANGNGRLRWLTIALPGVYGFRSVIGKTVNARGERIDVKGTIPDIESYIPWKGRTAYICYDVNVTTNPMVRAARSTLARLLESYEATVYLIDLPPSPGVNGMDDYLAIHGLDAFLKLYNNAARYNWRDELMRSDKNKILPSFGNALIALRLAPEWRGVLGFNEFALTAEARKQTPWDGPEGVWCDDWDLRATEWLEHHGIPVNDTVAGKAVLTVAREQSYHPVRDYLDGLKWDGIGRIDDWLTLYLGVNPSDYTRAVGAKWLISAVARVREPGCKADHALILEGLQGIGKSTVYRILGGEFYSDDIADLGTKDAALGAGGVWIVELAELDAMGRTEVAKIKSFISRSVDRFRPPYGRHLISVPRQCVFGGSVNLDKYLKDETGGRRFWPVPCGYVHLDLLRRDRDQLWAEAVVRYGKGETWWLDTAELIEDAVEQQEDRYQADPWESPIEQWLLNQTEVTTAEVLAGAIRKDMGYWTRADEIRVGVILNRLNWEVAGRPRKGNRRRVYRPKP